MEPRILKPQEKITEAGLYANVSMSRYHGPDLCDGWSASSSGLRKIFNASPAHYWSESSYNPHRAERTETSSLILGRAAHHLLLGESHFEREYVIRPDEIDGAPWQGNRKVCKAWLAEAALSGKTVLKGDQVDQIKGMSQSLAAHPLVQAGILNGLIESTMVYRDLDTGIWIKGRPDAMPSDCADFADLKTTTSVTDEDLQRTIFDYGYHMQGAVIGMCAREVLGIEMSSFSLVFVESKPPHCCRVVTLTPADIELGEQQVRVALALFEQGMRTGHWPGPGGTQTDASYISLPPWGEQKIKDRIAQLEREIAPMDAAA